MASISFVYESSNLEKLRTQIRTSFKITSEESNAAQSIIARFRISTSKSKLVITLYTTGKGLAQGNEGELFNRIKQLLKDSEYMLLAESHTSATTINELNIYKKIDNIIGFDESGKGEPIGPLIIGSVLLPADKYELFKDIKSNVKSMSHKELNYYVDLMRRNGIKYKAHIISAFEITKSPVNLDRLLDKQYIELLRKSSGILNKNYLLAFDDYGIKDELITYLKRLKKNNGVEVIYQHKIDEQITAAKLASIIARKIRQDEIEKLCSRNILLCNGKQVDFGKGANNDDAMNWLRCYRQIYPTFDFPDFVRSKWKNVEAINQEIPKKPVELHITCSHCNQSISKVLMRYDKPNNCIIYYCSNCNKILPEKHLKKFEYKHILCDTNAYVAGILSKDLNAKQSVFKKSCLIIPYTVIDEIETIKKDRKTGALKEISELRRISRESEFKMVRADYQITPPFDTDTKLYAMIAKENNLILISGDKTVVGSAEFIGALVFHIINYIPQ